MTDFVKRRALVVGGGGMGAEVCRQIADGGGDVYFTYNRNVSAAEELAVSLPAERVAGYCSVDISDDDAVATAVDAAATALGGIDVLVITAGYVHEMTLFENTDAASIRKTVDVELVGVITTAKAVLPHMRAGGYGRIVTVGSDSGKAGATGEAASAAARGGVIAFSKALARETARDDICVNVVCPGPTDTPLLDDLLADPGLTGKLTSALVRAVPKRRAARASEVGAMVAFLASEDASYVTGQAISVSGGLTMN